MPLPGSPTRGVVGDVAKTTTTNTAYEIMKQGGQAGDSHKYELICVPQVTSPPPAKDLEVEYEIPSLPPSH